MKPEKPPLPSPARARTRVTLPVAPEVFLSRMDTRASAEAHGSVLAAGADEDFARALSARLKVSTDVTEVGEITRRGGQTAKDGELVLTSLKGFAAADPPGEAHLRSTFLVDYDEPAFDAADQALGPLSPAETPRAVENFVQQYVTDKTHTRGFDIASEVLNTRAGDCSEHAVLAAALLRRRGVAARVVVGLVVVGIQPVQGEGRFLTAGHAWVEYHDGAVWRIVDPALQLAAADGLEGATVRRAYLPMTVLEREGVGFMRAIAFGFGPAQVRAVDLDRRAPAP